MSGKSLLCGLMVLASCFAMTSTASAHSAFKKKMQELYPDKKISCNGCHDPKDKKIRNAYGKLLQKQFESKTLTADWKAKKGKEKKQFEADVMVPEFVKSFEKVKAMTVHDLIEAGFFEGIDNREEEAAEGK